MGEVVNPVSRASILAIEDAIRRDLPPVDTPVTNHFGGGVYAREMFIPAGTTLTGKIHRKENLNLLLKGEILVATEQGVISLKGPQFIISPPGVKRVGSTLTDCVWVCFHPTEEKDLAVIEQTFIAQSYEEFDLLEGKSMEVLT